MLVSVYVTMKVCFKKCFVIEFASGKETGAGERTATQMATHSERRQDPPRTGTPMTEAEYFELDTLFPNRKYEYRGGKVWLMAGGTGEHDEIGFNVRAAIHRNFSTGPCFVRGSDMRVKVSENGDYYLPDVTVSCDVYDRRRGNTLIESPRLVVEVLSRGTERDDRGIKLTTYQACPTIQEIVFVSQYSKRVEIYRREREESNAWSYHDFGPDTQEVHFASIDVFVDMEEVYQGIDFDQPLEG